ncbi:hypothetical protein C4J81_11555 [Deltaproteobacteria bacterium Smac51]|nr:hypothetical protein C4J81_11555 [Deltaproteobacteria bacterium Smac51]
MTKITPLLNRFTFGEISPLVSGRSDLAKYPAGCKRLENFIPLLQGPIKRRGGTRYITTAANGEKPVALLEFAFSSTTTYIIEVGQGYMRFFCNGAPVLNNGFHYRIVTSLSQSQIFLDNGICALKYVQSGDVMYIVGQDMPPIKLARHGHLDWRLTTLPGWGTRPNPTAVALFRERLCLAAGQTVYMSQSGAFEQFQLTSEQKDNNGNVIVPVVADDPIEINIYSEQIDKIEWLCPSSGLLVGTSGSEFIISETTTVEPLGPENVKVVPETAFGSSSIQALRVGSVVMFVQRAGRKVREFVYDYSGDNYAAMDVTVAAEHITRGGITALAWQSEPIETLWAVRPDGQLIGFTYSREQDMSAWHRHVLGGGGQVAHIAVIPAAHGGRDELWLAVKRVVNGRTRYYIELMDHGHDPGEALEDAFFVDCGSTVTGSQMTTISGLNHLEGLEVDVLADGGVQPRQVVTQGAITLQYPADKVQVGLPYTSIMTTLNLEAQTQTGSSAMRLKRFTSATLKLIESGGGAAGPDENNMQQLEYRRGAQQMDMCLPLFTGDKKINWPGGYETEGALSVGQTYPLPFTLAAIIPEMLMEAG